MPGLDGEAPVCKTGPTGFDSRRHLYSRTLRCELTNSEQVLCNAGATCAAVIHLPCIAAVAADSWSGMLKHSRASCLSMSTSRTPQPAASTRRAALSSKGGRSWTVPGGRFRYCICDCQRRTRRLQNKAAAAIGISQAVLRRSTVYLALSFPSVAS